MRIFSIFPHFCRIIPLLAVIFFLIFAKTAYACYEPPEFYGLPSGSTCVGSWVQIADIHDFTVTLQCFNASNVLLYDNIVPTNVSVNEFFHPVSLEHAACQSLFQKEGRHLVFPLFTRSLSPVFTESITNYGDIYLERKNSGTK